MGQSEPLSPREPFLVDEGDEFRRIIFTALTPYSL
jgi:hypothetical protein